MKDNILKVHDEFADWTVTPQNLKSSKEVRKNLNKLKLLAAFKSQQRCLKQTLMI